MLVVDASVLVSAVADFGTDGQWAERVLLRGELAAPHLVLAEATNILRRLELQGRLTRSEATGAQNSLLRLRLELHAFEPFSDRVWQLRANVTSYDAWYVALAEALRVPLATLDARLTEATGPRCQFLLPD
jgi:predicted nucleic acid-binding protein